MRKIKMISGCRTYGSVVFDSGNLEEFKACNDEKCEGCQRFHKAMREYVENLKPQLEIRLINPLSQEQIMKIRGIDGKMEHISVEEAIVRYPDWEDKLKKFFE